MKTHKIF